MQTLPLQNIYAAGNQLDGVEPGLVGALPKLSMLSLTDNQFWQAAVDSVVDEIHAHVASYETPGKKILRLGGTNAAPSPEAIVKIAELEKSPNNWEVSYTGQ